MLFLSFVHMYDHIYPVYSVHSGFKLVASNLIAFSAKIFSRGNNVNVSHVIHDLSFGPKYPGIHNPLDGTTRILHDTSSTVKYFIKVNGDFCLRLKLIW